MQSSRPPAPPPPAGPAPLHLRAAPPGPGDPARAGRASARRPRARGGRAGAHPGAGAGAGQSERGKGRAPPAAPHLSNVENLNTSFKHLGNIRPPAQRMRPAPAAFTPLTGLAARGCGFVCHFCQGGGRGGRGQ